VSDGREAAQALPAREDAELSQRYERELMNPKRGPLARDPSRGSSCPSELRRELGRSSLFLMRHYTPSPMGGAQREFH
jgi:hypothetical protein